MLRGDRRSQSRGSDRRRLPRCRVDLMGLPVDRLSEEQTVETVLAALRAGRGGCLFTPNLHHVQAFATGADSDVYRSPARLEGARVVVADGMPLVWASCRLARLASHASQATSATSPPRRRYWARFCYFHWRRVCR